MDVSVSMYSLSLFEFILNVFWFFCNLKGFDGEREILRECACVCNDLMQLYYCSLKAMQVMLQQIDLSQEKKVTS